MASGHRNFLPAFDRTAGTPTSRRSDCATLAYRIGRIRGSTLRANDFAGASRALLIAALLLASAGSRAQEPGADDTPAADAAKDGCRSVVLVQCTQPEPEAKSDAPDDARAATRKKLEMRRLRQKQAQAGLNSIEVTAERAPNPEPDSWESFRQSISNAAVPDCLGQQAVPSVQGLLRAPVLVYAAAAGKCR